MLDPTGALIVEIRDALEDAGVTDRVRSPEPAPDVIDAAGTVTARGDARGPKDYIRFVVIVPLEVPPHPQLPITDARYIARCYGTDPHDAFLVYAALCDAIHAVGPRVKASGLGIYRSWIETGGTSDRDPDTLQPLITATIRLLATTQAVA